MELLLLTYPCCAVPGQFSPYLKLFFLIVLFNGYNFSAVEVYFLNDQTEEYLQVELGPWGQYYVFLFKGPLQEHRSGLPLDYEVLERTAPKGDQPVS